VIGGEQRSKETWACRVPARVVVPRLGQEAWPDLLQRSQGAPVGQRHAANAQGLLLLRLLALRQLLPLIFHLCAQLRSFQLRSLQHQLHRPISSLSLWHPLAHRE